MDNEKRYTNKEMVEIEESARARADELPHIKLKPNPPNKETIENKEYWILFKSRYKYQASVFESKPSIYNDTLTHVIDIQSYRSLEREREGLREALKQENIVNKIMEWKAFWMNQNQNDEADRKNYFDRAFGVDANMKYDLARRISELAGK